MYADLINKAINAVHQKGVATKILQGMDRIRNEFDEVQARRWPTELLQNARDLSTSDRPVRVRIELTDDAVRFLHSGRPFSVKDILSIINQVSSKSPGEGVGQFGTGFLSTFQLSMQVDVRSWLKEDGEPYRPFHVCLDRSGTTHEAISAAIRQAMEDLKAADRAGQADRLDPEALNTEFCYHLQDQRSRKIARMGVEDLRRTLPCILLFSRMLGEAELVIRTNDCEETLSFRRGTETELSGGLLRQEILCGSRARVWYTLQRDEIALAAAWDEERGFLPLPDSSPRLYIDFPLVGSDGFPFPVVLNSLRLRPNEPRSSVSLVEHEESLDARENRALLDRAAALYREFFPALLAIDRRGAEQLLAMPPQEERKEWSNRWVREHLYRALYDFLASQPLLPVQGAFHALAETGVRLVRAETPEQRERLAALCRQVRGWLVPEGETDWCAILAAYSLSEEKYITVRSLLERASGALRQGLCPGTEPAVWLAALYDLGMETEETAIRAGEFSLFPSQSPEDLEQFRLYTAREICLDPDFPELLKDCTQELDKLEPQGCLKLRGRLLHQGFRPQTPLFLPKFSHAELTDYIIIRSSRGFRVQGYNQRPGFYNGAWAAAWSLLLAAGPDKELYELCRAGWRTLPDYVGRDESFDARMWGNACRGVLNLLLEELKAAGNLEAWRSVLAARSPGTDVIEWLEGFYAKTAQYLSVSELFYSHILPNQYGRLRAPSELKLDKVGDEELKSISVAFKGERAECDLPNRLLEQKLRLPGWNLPSLDLEAAASGVNTALQQFLARTNLPDAPLELQEACTRLLGWIQEHPKDAERCFPTFCKEEDQMKLLTPRAAVSLRKKADRLSELMTLAGTDDPEELERLIRDGRRESSTEDQESFPVFDPESGLFFGEDWSGMGDEDRRERLRRIGEAGERCVFRAAVDYFTEQGFAIESEDAGTALLSRGEAKVTVRRPDTEDFHQAGWDIEVAIQNEQETSGYYLEVKTHVPHSKVRSLLPLSDTQMRLAAGLGDHYILLLVIYDETSDQALAMHPYQNVIRHLADGSLRGVEGRYVLQRMKREAADTIGNVIDQAM